MSPDELILCTEPHLAKGGDGVARFGTMVVFVHGAAPSEKVRARITAWKRDFARAEVIEILEPGPDRRAPPCSHFGVCGGCRWQHLTYEAQLRSKAWLVRDTLRRAFALDADPAVVVHAGPEFGYRSRARVAIELDGAKRAVGFRAWRSHATCDIEECPVLAPSTQALLTGLRTAPLRAGGDYEIAASGRGGGCEPPVAGLPFAPFPVDVGDVRYWSSAEAFFQANHFLLPELCAVVSDGDGGRLALDLFCGCGLFALPLARRFQRVVGVETARSAVELARRSVKEAGLGNVDVRCADAATWLEGFRRLVETGGAVRPDLVVLDPPRSGARDIIAALCALAPPRVVYVSCDPATLARDAAGLRDAYRLEAVHLFDLFPQTSHVETVIGLVRAE